VIGVRSLWWDAEGAMRNTLALGDAVVVGWLLGFARTACRFSPWCDV
jgi:hypothetical protein